MNAIKISCNKDYSSKIDKELKKKNDSRTRLTFLIIISIWYIYYVVSCLSNWIYEWLGNIWWNLITRKRRAL